MKIICRPALGEKRTYFKLEPDGFALKDATICMKLYIINVNNLYNLMLYVGQIVCLHSSAQMEEKVVSRNE